jgi:S1-C subfamily serine protease
MIARPLRLRLAAAALLAAAAVLAGLGLARARAATIGSGIVVVDTTLGYQDGAAAGTGIVLSSSGEVLTNNHVIRGATAIKVVVPGTGRSYKARVVGYDVPDDVAVLQLAGASNLKTAALATGEPLRVGQKVSATGNAGGTGSLATVTGAVTGLRRTIVAGDDEGDSEQLTGLIETDAAVVAGDSGGPLRDAGGNVVGMTTAASPSNQFTFEQASSSDAYAIPIGKALAVAQKIEAGTSTTAIHVGATAFLGVGIATAGGYYDTAGVVVTDVESGGPADRAGLVAGDVIVRVDGHAVASSTALRLRLLAKHPGQKVSITYADRYGSTTTVTAKLASGPPQ